MRRQMMAAALLLAALLANPAAVNSQDDYGLISVDIPTGRAVPPAVDVNLTDLARVLGVQPVAAWNPTCLLETPEGSLVPLVSQFDPGPGYHWEINAVGEICFILPEGVSGKVTLRVQLPGDVDATRGAGGALTQPITVENDFYAVTHDSEKQAGLPSRFEFKSSGKVFDEFVFNDRVYDRDLGQFWLRQSVEPRLEVSSGPVRTLVRAYLQYTAGGTRPASRPEAVYDFSYYPNLPIIGVRARSTQAEPFAWREHHFIEINYPGDDFSQYLTAGMPGPADLTAAEATHQGAWAALIDGPNTLALLGSRPRIYDGKGGYGTYLHGPWDAWASTSREQTVFLYVSADAEAVSQADRLASAVGGRPGASVTTADLERRLHDAENYALNLSLIEDTELGNLYLWAAKLVRTHALDGIGGLTALAEVLPALEKSADARNRDFISLVGTMLPDGESLSEVHNDEIGLAFRTAADGTVGLAGLYRFLDPAEDHLAQPQPALFVIELSDAEGLKTVLSADGKWGACRLEETAAVERTITWSDPDGDHLAGLTVTARVRLEGPRANWTLHVNNPSERWGIRTVQFPSLRLRRRQTAGGDHCFTPHASGVLTANPTTGMPAFSGTYPSGWCSMQFGGYYDSEGGVYFATHDPEGSRKTVSFGTSEGALACSYTWDAPDAGVPGTEFSTIGECAIELFSGDWFDAAQIYREWAQAHALWWPGGELEGRPDTPQWMREMPIWACMGGGPENVVDPCIQLREYLGVPLAVHWYNWHQIPFDDDYPHYFPVKDGFAEGVKRLQDNGVRVMPYINGRLWDTDLDDFPTVALPAATKDEKGEPYIEVYASGEKLAAMCPTTELWQDKVQEIVLRLVGEEYNVDGVYIDQVGAASARLCFDQSHGHSLGGGSWWLLDGYWPMLDSLRARLPQDKMITTECNAETYCKWFDGYLTWHFQYQGQIPLFAAVYGGQVQTFSRAYRANDGLAHRMKAAQSFVFGEQLGWLNANTILNDMEVLAPFFRRLAHLRYALLDYLSAGAMARPPLVEGDTPRVTADWAWLGKWEITDDALQRGAWRSRDGRLALLFVNVLDRPLDATLKFDGSSYDFDEDARLSVTRRTEDGKGDPAEKPCVFDMQFTIAPYGAVAYEIDEIM